MKPCYICCQQFKPKPTWDWFPIVTANETLTAFDQPICLSCQRTIVISGAMMIAVLREKGKIQ